MTRKRSSAPHAEFTQPFHRQLQHLVVLAPEPAWRAHVCWRVLELEADQSGLWHGIKAALMEQVPGLEKAMESVAREMTKRR